MGLVKRLGWPEDFQLLTADRISKGFAVIQIVAGLYPDMPPFDLEELMKQVSLGKRVILVLILAILIWQT